ncbi:hypothetical protein Lalb_Chr14g0364301 [Lupinus albus]|uniref:Uncharacterized protein n=1 Tax=Lupinus albus TaxID=3870 RepID=A0A6A4PF17_LUPAL|nr:hypothetical protein Lalb_Chr14g0364301 [Lupinus albus]
MFLAICSQSSLYLHLVRLSACQKLQQSIPHLSTEQVFELKLEVLVFQYFQHIRCSHLLPTHPPPKECEATHQCQFFVNCLVA